MGGRVGVGKGGFAGVREQVWAGGKEGGCKGEKEMYKTKAHTHTLTRHTRQDLSEHVRS